ncbi:MAG: helix-turn-helix transcriptional regulator [Acidaminococcaceae bacterium]|nr:helix-turn-helix transcriptional regulator [Acidaminococcaceae bacterium]MBQ5343821.1 helix-turn-helix transcriptional regulator [Acidaminococcaceae bacterium]MBR1661819.1 helix-turn-helix transcriptional regulator [Acidaminococcaceae bacterium]
MDQDVDLPQLIRSCRATTRWTQDQLAAVMKVKKVTVYRWEHGIATPSSDNLTRLILIFRIECQKKKIGLWFLDRLRSLLPEPHQSKPVLTAKQRKVMQLGAINQNLRRVAAAR